MMPHCKSDNQFELFESAATDGQRPPKLALPFQRSAEVDIKRIARILAISTSSVLRMIKAGLIRSISIPGESQPRVNYDAVVEYCNRLRLEYRITDRLLPKLQGRRHREEELLPFPLHDSIGIAEVQERLQCTKEVARRLIEEGALIAYQVYISERGSPWRIQRQSLDRYIESLHLANACSRQQSPSRL